MTPELEQAEESQSRACRTLSAGTAGMGRTPHHSSAENPTLPLRPVQKDSRSTASGEIVKETRISDFGRRFSFLPQTGPALDERRPAREAFAAARAVFRGELHRLQPSDRAFTTPTLATTAASEPRTPARGDLPVFQHGQKRRETVRASERRGARVPSETLQPPQDARGEEGRRRPASRRSGDANI